MNERPNQVDGKQRAHVQTGYKSFLYTRIIVLFRKLTVKIDKRRIELCSVCASSCSIYYFYYTQRLYYPLENLSRFLSFSIFILLN